MSHRDIADKAQQDQLLERINTNKEKIIALGVEIDKMQRQVTVLERLTVTDAVLDAIRDERQHQDARWGGWAHDRLHTLSEWYSMIAPRIAEASRGNRISHDDRRLLLEATALLVAWLECLDREGSAGNATG